MHEYIDKSKTKCLNNIFTYLNKNGISYCVVGDSKCLPERITSDIDIVISNNDIFCIQKKIIQFSKKNECQLVQVFQHENTAFYFVLSWIDGNGKVAFLHPDICSDYYRKGKPFLFASDLLSGRILAASDKGMEKQFYVPAPEMEFIYYFIKKIDKRSINQNQYEHLREQYLRSPNECHTWLHKYWSQSNVSIIVELLKHKEVKDLQIHLAVLQQGLLINNRSSVRDHWYEFVRKVRRVLQPTGLVIVLLGPDGSGKSSVIEKIMCDLAPAFRKTQYIHFRPNIGKRRKENNAPVDDPHSQKPRSWITSVVKILYLLFDYGMGYLLKIRPMLVRSTLVVFDRYYHDILVDPKRYRYGGYVWFVRAVGKLIPKPDLFILLNASAEVLQERKQEVSYEETERQQKKYLKLMDEVKNGVIINAEQEIDKVVADVNSAVLDYMRRRTERRIG